MKDKIKPLILVDNDYLLRSIDADAKNWWKKVNEYIASSFVNVQSLFDIKVPKKGEIVVSSEKGVSNLDVGEAKRLFQTEGLLDIKTIVFQENKLVEGEEIFFKEFEESLADESLSGRYNLKNALAYSCSIVVNEDFDEMNKFRRIFNIVAKKMSNAAIKRESTLFKKDVHMELVTGIKVKLVKVIIIATGFKLPKEINDKIRKIKVDAKKFHKTKSQESKVKLTEDVLVDSVGEEFQL